MNQGIAALLDKECVLLLYFCPSKSWPTERLKRTPTDHLTLPQLRSAEEAWLSWILCLETYEAVNEGTGGAVFPVEALGEKMLPSASRLLAESGSCICVTRGPTSLLVPPGTYPELLEASLWSLHRETYFSEPVTTYWTLTLGIFPYSLFCHFSLILTRARFTGLDWVLADNPDLYA